MKSMTMCIITILILSTPLADTQTEQNETLALIFDYEYVEGLDQEMEDLKLLFRNKIDKRLKSKGKQVHFIDQTYNRKWDKALIIVPVECGTHIIFIVNFYARFSKEMMDIKVRNMKLPIVPLLIDTPLCYKFDTQKGSLKTITDTIVEHTVDNLLIQDTKILFR